MSIHVNVEKNIENEMRRMFLGTIHFLDKCIGKDVFRKGGRFNISLFESIMLIGASELDASLDCDRFKNFYNTLINSKLFESLSRHSTTSKTRLIERIKLAEEIYRAS